MLQKFRKRSLMHSSNLVKFVDFSSKTTKRIIFLDFLFIAGATYGFGYMHFSIDFRQKVQKHFPFFLESYYVLNSVVFRNKTLKETDFQTWGIPLEEDDTKT